MLTEQAHHHRTGPDLPTATTEQVQAVLERREGRSLIAVEPVVITMAVRYCLGRSSYAPGLIAETVRSVWSHLGQQQDVITQSITEWLNEDWHDHPARDTWLSVLRINDGTLSVIDRESDTP